VGIAVDVDGGKLYWTQKGDTKAGEWRQRLILGNTALKSSFA
jgi:hypothetical protein